MNRHIIITPEQAEQIKGKYGKYSAIEPVPTPDGNYIIPERCLNDADLVEAKAKIEAANGDVQDITDLPDTGTIEKNRLYQYNGQLVKAVQAHERTIYQPEQTPALFSFFRENSDDLEWIPNEWVKLGWKRWYEGIQYEVFQAHQTQETWNPVDTLDVLWTKAATQEEKPPQWDTNNWGDYTVGYQVYDSGKIWEAINETHTWIQPALEGNGAISWKFVKDWVE